MKVPTRSLLRHGWARPGHPRLARPRKSKESWMPGTTRPSMTEGMSSLASSVVDRKAADERLDLLAHRGLDQRILLGTLLGEHIEHLDDQVAHLAEFGNAEAAS